MVNRFGYNEPTFEILRKEMTDSEIRSVSGGRCNGCGKRLRVEDFRKIRCFSGPTICRDNKCTKCNYNTVFYGGVNQVKKILKRIRKDPIIDYKNIKSKRLYDVYKRRKNIRL